MRESYRKQRQEEPLTLNLSRAEHLLRVFPSKILQLVEAKVPGGAKVGARVFILEAKVLPQIVLQVLFFQIVDYLENGLVFLLMGKVDCLFKVTLTPNRPSLLISVNFEFDPSRP